MTVYNKEQMCYGLSNQEVYHARILRTNILGYKSDEGIWTLRYANKYARFLNHMVTLAQEYSDEEIREYDGYPEYVHKVLDYENIIEYDLIDLATYNPKKEIFTINVCTFALKYWGSRSYNHGHRATWEMADTVERIINDYCPVMIRHEPITDAVKYMFPNIVQGISTKTPLTVRMPMSLMMDNIKAKSVGKLWIRE